MGIAIVYLEEDTEMTQASSTRFLIVGAGGSHGATGNHVARQLLARGMRVRAFVRRADERADELKELGAEIAVGDIRDYTAVRAALDAVQRAYFTYPLADGLLLATATFAASTEPSLRTGNSFSTTFNLGSVFRRSSMSAIARLQ